MREIVVVGGGASGLIAAITAAENPENHVTLLERQSRVGRKLLSTGNGRCNLTNLNAAPECYHGAEQAFVASVLSRFSVADTLGWFRAHGLVTVSEPDGRVYPYSNMANSVVDILRFGADASGVTLAAGAAVEQVHTKGHCFTIQTADRSYAADALIVACGGAAGSKLGGVMDGYQLLKSLGHHRTALFPSLVQVKTDPTYPRSLKGVKAQARLSVRSERELLAENTGEILFTEYGVSGPAVFEISRVVSTTGDSLHLVLDFWPDASDETIMTYLRAQRSILGEKPCGSLLCGVVNGRLGQMICKAAGFTSQSAHTLSDDDLRRIARRCKQFELPITGVCGFDSAQVTAGGMRTDEFDSQTMGSRLVSGLYACGEVLDVDGDCGGFNLQWAWSSGHLAGLLKGGT
jgi:predicted Rossmann fold flavoprotein